MRRRNTNEAMDSFLHAANTRAIDAAASYHGAAIPVIDFSLQEAAASKVSGELAHALENVGFFFLDNHGIDQKLIAAVFAEDKGVTAETLTLSEA